MLSVTVLNSGLNISAFLFAEQAILGPMAGLTLVFNVLISYFFVKEVVSASDWGGMAVTVAGVGVCAAFGQHSSQDHTLDQMLHYYTKVCFPSVFQRQEV